MEYLLMFWVLCGVAAAVVANNKQRDGCGWFLLGMLLGPIGLFMIAFLGPGKGKRNLGTMEIVSEKKKCPFCGEEVKKEAIKCKHCGSELPPVAQAMAAKIIDKQPSPVVDEATKRCPFCAETIKHAAVICRFCNRDLPPAMETTAPLADDHSTAAGDHFRSAEAERRKACICKGEIPNCKICKAREDEIRRLSSEAESSKEEENPSRTD